MTNLWTKIKAGFSFVKIKNYVFKHKVISLILLVIIIFGAYKGYVSYTNTSGETRYVVSTVEKGTITSTVSGTGQVSASSQVELKPKASGEIVYLGAKTGGYVNAGQLIMQIDSRNAKIDLENAKLNLQKMVESSGTGLGGSNGLAKDYEDGFSNVNSVFSDLPEIMNGLDIMLNNYQSSVYKINLPDNTANDYYKKATKSYYATKDIYNQTLNKYQNLSRPLTNANVSSIINDTYNMLQALNQMVKDSDVYISYTYDKTDSSSRSVSMTTDKNNVSTWLKTINSDLALIGSSRDTLKNSSLSIASQKLTLQQKEYAYQDYFLYAPFSGLVQISATQNDSVNSGTSIGTIVSNKKIATVSLNEVDIARVKVGQKANLTFDAIDGLTIIGEVTEVDIVGTVSQGVVSYNAKIAFDSQDSRIRSGMSASADIAVDVKPDILVVPSSAIKTSGNKHYVETLGAEVSVTGRRGVTSAIVPGQIFITTGLSDDTNTEILSGLKEGDKIITQTLAPSTAAKSAGSITSLLRPSGQQKTTTKSSSTSRNSTASARSSMPGVGGHPDF